MAIVLRAQGLCEPEERADYSICLIAKIWLDRCAVQALSSSATHPLIIIMFSVQAHGWMVVEKEWGAAVARLICQMIDDSKLRDCQVTYCP